MIYIIYLEDCCREIKQIIGYTTDKGKAHDYCRKKNVELYQKWKKDGINYEYEYDCDEVKEI